MTGRKLTGRETRMWSSITKSVSKIKRDPEPKTKPDLSSKPVPKPLQEPKQGNLSTQDIEKLTSGRFSSAHKPKTPLEKRKAGLADRAHEKRVRRGRVPYGGTLDLHGYTQDTGRSALLSFLSQHQDLGDSSVLVITGKGRMGEGVLRRCLIEWIDQSDFRKFVSGYSRANQKHGGDGAFYLFIRKKKD